MARLTAKERTKDDRRIVKDEREARSLVSGGAVGWQRTRNAVLIRDRDKPCCRCGTAIDWSAPGTDRMGPTIDHLGLQVGQAVGMNRGAARAALLDKDHLAVSHRYCNVKDGRGVAHPPPQSHYEPTTTAKQSTTTNVEDLTRKREACEDTRWQLSRLQLRMDPYRNTPEDERQRLTVELVAKMNSEYRAA